MSGQGSICAEGGGSLANDAWAAPAFDWMMKQARPFAERTKGGEGGVRVVVLGSRDGEQDQPAEEEPAEGSRDAASRFKACGAASVRQFSINATGARDEQLAAAIRDAHIIWIRGGSQTRYCQWWKGSPVESAIREVYSQGGVVGGTSAGCAVLGEVIYDAAGGSCDAAAALRDPFARQISFTTGFLELTPGVIFDSHFTERARIARLAVFLGRIRVEQGRDVLGIGMDSRTALCVDPNGVAEVFGTGAACLMHLTPDSRITIRPPRGEWPTPPLITGISLRQIVAGERVNIRELTSGLLSCERIAELSREWSVEPAELKKEVDRTDARFIRGDASMHARRGRFFIDPDLPQDALFTGALVLSKGTDEVPGAVVATRCLAFAERTQNAAGGVLWALATTDARWGSFMEMGAAIRLTDDGRVQSYFPHGKLGPAMSAPVFIKTDAFRPGEKPRDARQTCSFEGLRMHVLSPGWTVSLRTGDAAPPVIDAAP